MPRVTLRSEQLSRELNDYLVGHSAGPDAVLSKLAGETASSYAEHAHLQIGPEQGTFMTLLTRLAGARRALEIGTFTGYSSICIARGLSGGGLLTCCDVSEEWTSVARRYWQLAGLSSRIELRLGPAAQTLRQLPASEVFDLAFIDADKTSYVRYWDEIVPRIRPGGVILVDNTLAHGHVVEADSLDPNVQGIRAFNERAATDERVEVVLLPISDGLTLARRK
jgi:caffeoyl-CoA O-methyltransferase